MHRDQAPQANAGQFTGKGAKPKAPGLRKRRKSDNGVCYGCCGVGFPCYKSECRSTLSLHILLTLCALFFCVLLKPEEISRRFRYFPEYTVRFYIFVKLEEISPKGLNNGK